MCFSRLSESIPIAAGGAGAGNSIVGLSASVMWSSKSFAAIVIAGDWIGGSDGGVSDGTVGTAGDSGTIVSKLKGLRMLRKVWPNCSGTLCAVGLALASEGSSSTFPTSSVRIALKSCAGTADEPADMAGAADNKGIRARRLIKLG